MNIVLLIASTSASSISFTAAFAILGLLVFIASVHGVGQTDAITNLIVELLHAKGLDTNPISHYFSEVSFVRAVRMGIEHNVIYISIEANTVRIWNSETNEFLGEHNGGFPGSTFAKTA